MVDLQAIYEQPSLIHPDIISEIPLVKTTVMYERIIGQFPIGKEDKYPSYAEGVIMQAYIPTIRPEE